MATQRNSPFVFPLILLLTMIGCTDSPTDDGSNTNGTGDSSNLALDGAEFIVEVFTDYENPTQNDILDTTTVRVATDPSDHAGRSSVHHYQMFAGFVTDKVFHGSVVEKSNGDLSIYYAGNMQNGNTFWWFYDWIDYPINGTAVLVVIHDSADASGTLRQQVTWKAGPGGAENVTIGGTMYSGMVVNWEMKTVRFDDGKVDQVLTYYGEDIWVSELAFVAERYIEAEVDDQLWFTSTATLIDHTIPAD